MPNSKVLIVDDEKYIRLMLNKGLQKEGYLIEEAANGEEALEKIRKFNPHIVLLDVNMPGVTGNYLIETIKELKPETQVIMVTGVDMEAIKIESYFKGAFDFIAKPIDMGYLKSAVNRAIEFQRKKPKP